MNTGPIILIEDDPEDQEMVKEALNDLKVGQSLVSFESGTVFLEWLKRTEEKPFLIFCSLHLAQIGGIDLRKRIDEDPMLRKRSIPFVFLSTDNRASTIESAYETTVQGYFIKDNTFEGLVRSLKVILDYWTLCEHPNSEKAKK